ncbi:MAG: DUF4915 domain-containing protein, partial [Acidobacteria bacterium]|nr:DUF4915 domain-containing protein [Acidobacteriota bacterium]
MSADLADSRQQAPADGVRYTEVRFEYTPNFRSILQQLGASLMVSTYQAGKVAAVGVAEQGLSLSFFEFERAMGLAVQPE